MFGRKARTARSAKDVASEHGAVLIQYYHGLLTPQEFARKMWQIRCDKVTCDACGRTFHPRPKPGRGLLFVEDGKYAFELVCSKCGVVYLVSPDLPYGRTLGGQVSVALHPEFEDGTPA